MPGSRSWDIATEVGTLPPRLGHCHQGWDIATEVGTLPPRLGHCHQGWNIATEVGTLPPTSMSQPQWQCPNFGGNVPTLVAMRPTEVGTLRSPTNPDQKIIKRIIALEGDTVKTLSYKNRYVTVPQGHCWLEGDHHGQSLDSNLFGPVALGLITAKASHIVWPPARWQKLEPDAPEGRLNTHPLLRDYAYNLLESVMDISRK
ncbi:Mitochondrial inner membrane protease subunit 2 [Lamellibrachia satsuma]|nr:Mitochondrial inner membrane protease subunit 2 [Lamellibrachia satsuma]